MQGDIEISPFFSCDSEMSKLWNPETYWNSISIQVYERKYWHTGKTCRASTKTIWSSWVQKPCNLYSRGNMTEHLLLTYLNWVPKNYTSLNSNMYVSVENGKKSWKRQIILRKFDSETATNLENREGRASQAKRTRGTCLCDFDMNLTIWDIIHWKGWILN